LQNVAVAQKRLAYTLAKTSKQQQHEEEEEEAATTTTMDDFAFVQLLLLALRCFIGIRKRQIQYICVDRQVLIGRRLRSRRQIITL